MKNFLIYLCIFFSLVTLILIIAGRVVDYYAVKETHKVEVMDTTLSDIAKVIASEECRVLKAKNGIILLECSYGN